MQKSKQAARGGAALVVRSGVRAGSGLGLGEISRAMSRLIKRVVGTLNHR